MDYLFPNLDSVLMKIHAPIVDVEIEARMVASERDDIILEEVMEYTGRVTLSRLTSSGPTSFVLPSHASRRPLSMDEEVWCLLFHMMGFLLLCSFRSSNWSINAVSYTHLTLPTIYSV